MAILHLPCEASPHRIPPDATPDRHPTPHHPRSSPPLQTSIASVVDSLNFGDQIVWTCTESTEILQAWEKAGKQVTTDTSKRTGTTCSEHCFSRTTPVVMRTSLALRRKERYADRWIWQSQPHRSSNYDNYDLRLDEDSDNLWPEQLEELDYSSWRRCSESGSQETSPASRAWLDIPGFLKKLRDIDREWYFLGYY